MPHKKAEALLNMHQYNRHRLGYDSHEISQQAARLGSSCSSVVICSGLGLIILRPTFCLGCRQLPGSSLGCAGPLTLDTSSCVILSV